MSKAWAKGSTRAYRRLRRSVLERDGYRCRIATPGTWTTGTGATRRCMGVANVVHHTRGRGRTGDNPAYMQAACAPCNARLGDPLAYTMGRAARGGGAAVRMRVTERW